MIKIENKDCFDMMRGLNDNTINIVLTSPPYNNSRTSNTEYCLKTANCRYEEYSDSKTNEEYCNWTRDLFNEFDRILKPNGVILYNISYGNENPNVMFEAINAVIVQTPFMIGDVIVWKKKAALPNNVSPNHLTRICEFVFVFCRKDEYHTYQGNKQEVSKSRTGQPFYENIFNFVEANNNDGVTEFNRATYSTELCEKLLKIYAKDGNVVYDPFMGTGTTAVACKNLGLDCYGSELSAKQVEYALNRLDPLKYNINIYMSKIRKETNNNKVSLW